MSSDSSFSRPERSSARGHEGSNATGGGGGITGALTNAANQMYQNAPDLGVGATINSYIGSGQSSAADNNVNGGASKAVDTFDEQEDDRVLRSSNKKNDNSATTASSNDTSKASTNEAETPRQLSERTGPSDQSRVGKSQFEVGTETGIPTSAGIGSTASPDKTNQKAIEKADSQGKISKAHIPDDYEPLSTPSGGGGGGIDDGPDKDDSRRQSANEGAERQSTSQTGTKSPKSPSSRKTSGHYAPPTASDGSPLEMEKRRSMGEKVMDQIKGEMKILAGTVTGSDDKIMKGLAIKHGDHA